MNKNALPHLIVVILFIGLLCVSCGSKDQAGDDQAIGTKQESKSPSSEQIIQTDLPQVQLGEVYRSPEGGYEFRVVPDYLFEEFAGIISMQAPDADPETGPLFMLVGGLNEQTKTTEQLLEDFREGLGEDGEIRDRSQITIGGIPGLMVNFDASVEGEPTTGRAVFVAVTPTQMFSLFSFAPPEQSEGEISDIFDALIASLSFFEPELDTAGEPEIPEAVVSADTTRGELIRQWASSAVASSEYSNPDYAAMQATGAPDTPDCGDRPTAWSSLEYFTIDWLEVGYDTAVIPSEVNIYESHTPSQVVLVELVDTDGAYHSIYTAEPEMQIDCPFILSIPVRDLDFPVVAVKITVDQSKLDLPLDEIDAVELVGYALEPGEVAQEPGEATQPAQPGKSTEPSKPAQATSPPQPSQATQLPGLSPVEATDLANWKWTNYTNADGLADNAVTAIAAAPDGTVWVGTFNAGVSSFKDGKFSNYGVDDGLGFNNGNGLAIAPDGSVWAATTGGLAHIEDGTITNYKKADGLVYDDVRSVLVTPEGVVWAGTSSGVSRSDGNTWTSFTKEDGLVDNYINDIAIDEGGTLWFATLGGVSSFDGENWTNYTEEDGLAYKLVRTIAVAPDGSIWAGTSSKGVNRFDGSEWVTYSVSDEYDLSYVKAIAVGPDGTLWFTTEGKGVYRYDGQNWLNIRKADGMPGDYVDAIVFAEDGSIWFGLRKEGIAHFGP